MAATKLALTVDGKPARIHSDDKAFTWSIDGGEVDHTIEWNDIIAVFPKSSSDSQGDHTLLYVQPQDSANNATTPTFGHISLGKPGEVLRLLNRSQIPESSAWPAYPDSPSDDHQRYVVVSTSSGTGLAKATWQRIQPLFHSLGYEEGRNYQIHFTTSETSVTELVQSTISPRANKGIQQTILLLSGDGGIVDLANGLLSAPRTSSYRKPTISLLPLGTGNALANSSGLTNDNTLGLKAALHGHPRPLPLFRATFSRGARLLVDEGRREQQLYTSINSLPTAHGAVVCSWGHHAALVTDSDTVEYRKFGAERFKMAAKEALFPADGSSPHAYRGRVMIRSTAAADWEGVGTGAHGYVLATFVGQLEKGFTISPLSKPLDGKLRLVRFGDLSGKDAMDVMTKAFQGGGHVEDERVGYQEIVGLKIEVDEDDGRWRRFCVDGKIIKVEKGGWVEVGVDVEGVLDLVCQEETT